MSYIGILNIPHRQYYPSGTYNTGSNFDQTGNILPPTEGIKYIYEDEVFVISEDGFYLTTEGQ